MASGSFEKQISKTYSNGSYFKAYLDWTSTGDASTNTSTITATLKLYCPYKLGISARTHYINIDGTSYKVSSSAISTSGGQTYTLGTATKTVSHNSNGTKSIALSFSVYINAELDGVWTSDPYTASKTITLDTLDNSGGGGGGDEPTDETYPELYWPSGASNTYYVGDTIKVNVKRYQYGVYSWYLLLRLSDNKYYNMNVSSSNPNGDPRAITSYSYTIPEDVYNHMKESLEDEAEINIGICDYASDQLLAWGEDLPIKIKINPDLVKPVISDVELTNNSVELTGDEDTLIRYVSNATGYFEAVGQKGATIKSMTITNGSQSTSYLPGTIYGVESGTFTFTATDSRGLTTTQTLTKTLIDYIKLTCNLDIKPPTAEGNLSNATIKGNFYNQNFGGSQNTLTLQYRYKVNDGAYTSWINTTPTLTDNTYTYHFSMEGLDYQSEYTFQAKAKDALLEVLTEEITVRTTPVFDWGENDFQFNVPVYFNQGITIGGVEECRMLWLGENQMATGTRITLNQGISEQKHGIVLVFSRYDVAANAAANTSFNCFFVPKTQAEFHMGEQGHTFFMGINAGFSLIGAKYLGFPADNQIQGLSSNTSSGQNSGIMFDNSQFCLRYVIGV